MPKKHEPSSLRYIKKEILGKLETSPLKENKNVYLTFLKFLTQKML